MITVEDCIGLCGLTEEEVLAGDGAIGLELAHPVPVGRLRGEKRGLRPLDGGIDLGVNDRRRSHARFRKKWVARIARY